jgi:DNA-binding NarL/FixJ family response regulator
MTTTRQTHPFREPAPALPRLDTDPSELSARERDVLELVASGLSNQEIAESLYVSNNTVKTYIRTAYRKIGAERRSQAVLWAIQHGLLSIPGVTITVEAPEDSARRTA